MRLDQYNIRQGKMFAIELIAMAPANLSVQPIIDNLVKSMVNKPPAQQEGIRLVIQLLEAAPPPVVEPEPDFPIILDTLAVAWNSRKKGVKA